MEIPYLKHNFHLINFNFLAAPKGAAQQKIQHGPIPCSFHMQNEN